MARRPTPKKRGATNSRRQPKPARGGIPGWLWGIAGLVAGFFLAQYVQDSAPTPLATVLPKPSTPTESSQAPEGSSAASEPRMPTFEFYTLLPESEVIAPRSEVVVPPPQPPAVARAEPGQAEVDPIAIQLAQSTASEAEAVAATPEPAPAPTANNSRYMLQAASFRESGDAQRLAGRLRDFGLLAQISEVEASDGDTWHRVQVGPYEDTRELNRAQDLMITQGIEPLMIRLQN
ncbi:MULTISPECIES: SPOR domain-containing protein [Halomonadaceae]|uniref:SPOR domain-containing protein n=1 Tax=Halomonadaceae TaxID=28256 RepID=UPI0015982CCB|nr:MULTISPECIES: SPOR domain-containing protein [Halomonas]QJQ95067.1 SPOR domain-containing protein [Halomonas sp. PA5]